MFCHIVKPDDKVKLADIDASWHDGLAEEEALQKLDRLGAKMNRLQDLLYAAKEHALLVILQGRDTSGKDGSIRRILHYCNGQSTRVVPFKQPTPVELGHDFLWRIHSQTPAKGDVTIFNRSHYEDVLVARVHKLVAKKVWKCRYAYINAFESLLSDSQTIIVKFYLHITKEEQEKRLLAREEDPDKSYKLSIGDWTERELWDDYTEAFEDALSRCSPKHAPWYVVPANHKWFRDLAIAEAIVKTLEPYSKGWHEGLKELGCKERAAIDAFRNCPTTQTEKDSD